MIKLSMKELKKVRSQILPAFDKEFFKKNHSLLRSISIKPEKEQKDYIKAIIHYLEEDERTSSPLKEFGVENFKIFLEEKLLEYQVNRVTYTERDDNRKNSDND